MNTGTVCVGSEDSLNVLVAVAKNACRDFIFHHNIKLTVYHNALICDNKCKW